MQANLEIIHRDERTLLVRPIRDVKMENARDLYNEFMGLVTDQTSEVVFDFSHVNFIDSSGVGILLRCAEFLKENQGTLYLCRLSRQVETVFKLAGLLKIFSVLTSEEVENRYPDHFA